MYRIWLSAAVISGLFISSHAHAQDIDRNGPLLYVRGHAGQDHIQVYERHYWGYYDRTKHQFVPGGTYVVAHVKDRFGKTLAYRTTEKSGLSIIKVWCFEGDDYVSLETDIDAEIDGGAGADELHGGDGDDEIDAGPYAEEDLLFGHLGDDHLIAGRPADFVTIALFANITWLYGGPGKDQFTYKDLDYLELEPGIPALGLTPDFSWRSGPFAGMHTYFE